MDFKTGMQKFNIRVYGILINESNEVLVSDECRNEFSFTKFPGGGMEFGESFTQTVKREFEEELGIEIEVGELYYFNDFVQESAFNLSEQLFSFYFKVKYDSCQNIEVNQHEVPLTQEGEKHRWIKLTELEIDDFTFPIDKIVAKKLRNQ